MSSKKKRKSVDTGLFKRIYKSNLKA